MCLVCGSKHSKMVVISIETKMCYMSRVACPCPPLDTCLMTWLCPTQFHLLLLLFQLLYPSYLLHTPLLYLCKDVSYCCHSIHSLLPHAPHHRICTPEAANFIKASNFCFQSVPTTKEHPLQNSLPQLPRQC